jgi:hypothetical protein
LPNRSNSSSEGSENADVSLSSFFLGRMSPFLRQ